MRVILKQRVEKLGQMGDIVEVKPGYARHFLLPKGYADRATDEKIAAFEQKRVQLEAHNLELVQEARVVAERMEGLKIFLVRSAGESGHLYGSVRSVDVAESITEEGFSVTKHQVHIEKPIKETGIHKVRLLLHPEVDVEVTLNIGLTQEEARSMTEESLVAAKEKELEDKKAPVFEGFGSFDDEKERAQDAQEE